MSLSKNPRGRESELPDRAGPKNGDYVVNPEAGEFPAHPDLVKAQSSQSIGSVFVEGDEII